jgi:hypothetical protein
LWNPKKRKVKTTEANLVNPRWEALMSGRKAKLSLLEMVLPPATKKISSHSLVSYWQILVLAQKNPRKKIRKLKTSGLLELQNNPAREEVEAVVDGVEQEDLETMGLSRP